MKIYYNQRLDENESNSKNKKQSSQLYDKFQAPGQEGAIPNVLKTCESKLLKSSVSYKVHFNITIRKQFFFLLSIQNQHPEEANNNIINDSREKMRDILRAVYAKAASEIKVTPAAGIPVASLIMSNEIDNSFEIICITSGCKQQSIRRIRSLPRLSLHDCRAEIVIRRCFKRFIYNELYKMVNNSYSSKCNYANEIYVSSNSVTCVINRLDTALKFSLQKISKKLKNTNTSLLIRLQTNIILLNYA